MVKMKGSDAAAVLQLGERHLNQLNQWDRRIGWRCGTLDGALREYCEYGKLRSAIDLATRS
jgi:hypothetical protein